MGETASREIIKYEYWFISTPRFTHDFIDETWELHQVFHSWLPNGSHNFIVAFRREYKRKDSK